MMKLTEVGAELQPALSSLAPQQPRAAVPARADDLIQAVREAVLRDDPEFQTYGRELTAPAVPIEGSSRSTAVLSDYLFASEDGAQNPDTIFSRLRWGGQFVYASRQPARVKQLAEKFVDRGYEIVRGPAVLRQPWHGWRIPLLSRKVHYFIARRVSLTLPKEISERFTYHVRLVRDCPAAGAPAGYTVLKEVPTLERVCARLRHRFPEATEELITKRARKFTEKVFPVFLTREAAMLKILEKSLPSTYLDRVPRAVHLEQDERGYVRRLWMNWLRAAPPEGNPLSQLEFARQAADLLRLMHDEVGVMHLDLRLDNMVITDRGVGFVDFGSAVRVGEKIQENALLSTIFDELMRTSQIQRMLEKMTADGAVTNRILNDAYGRIDKGVDLFYLALQITNPLINPDFRGLVQVDPGSDEALGLSEVSQDVLKPVDSLRSPVQSAGELLRAVERLGFALRGSGLRR